MTEHKFGTWYPIEDLKEICREVLFWDRSTIEMGWKNRDMDGRMLYRCAKHAVIYPTHFMPLPPPPKEI